LRCLEHDSKEQRPKETRNHEQGCGGCGTEFDPQEEAPQAHHRWKQLERYAVALARIRSAVSADDLHWAELHRSP
jgi:hypothetical protein